MNTYTYKIWPNRKSPDEGEDLIINSSFELSKAVLIDLYTSLNNNYNAIQVVTDDYFD